MIASSKESFQYKKKTKTKTKWKGEDQEKSEGFFLSLCVLSTKNE